MDDRQAGTWFRACRLHFRLVADVNRRASSGALNGQGTMLQRKSARLRQMMVVHGRCHW
jgi:hypothetical protein